MASVVAFRSVKAFRYLREGFSGLPEFLLGGRSNERLELLEPVTGGVIEVLLAEHAVRVVLHHRKRLTGIGEFLREPTGVLPKHSPGFRACPSQHPC